MKLHRNMIDYDTVVVEPRDRRKIPMLYKYEQHSIIGGDELQSMLFDATYVGTFDVSLKWSDLSYLPKARSKIEILHQFCLIELGRYEP